MGEKSNLRGRTRFKFTVRPENVSRGCKIVQIDDTADVAGAPESSFVPLRGQLVDLMLSITTMHIREMLTRVTPWHAKSPRGNSLP